MHCGFKRVCDLTIPEEDSVFQQPVKLVVKEHKTNKGDKVNKKVTRRYEDTGGGRGRAIRNTYDGFSGVPVSHV